MASDGPGLVPGTEIISIKKGSSLWLLHCEQLLYSLSPNFIKGESLKRRKADSITGDVL